MYRPPNKFSLQNLLNKKIQDTKKDSGKLLFNKWQKMRYFLYYNLRLLIYIRFIRKINI